MKAALTTADEARSEGLISRTIAVYKYFDHSYRKAYKGETTTSRIVFNRTTAVVCIADLGVAKSFEKLIFAIAAEAFGQR